MLSSPCAATVLLALAAGPALACPGLNPAAEPVVARVRLGVGMDFFMPFTVTALGGGVWNLRDCGLEGEGLTGYDGDAIVEVRPDFVLRWLGGLPQLAVAVENEQDTILLIHDPEGGWHFDDDSRGHDPLLVFDDPPPGDYAIWIGATGTTRFTLAGTLVIDDTAP